MQRESLERQCLVRNGLVKTSKGNFVLTANSIGFNQADLFGDDMAKKNETQILKKRQNTFQK